VKSLPAKSQLCDEASVTLDILTSQVVEKSAALADHHQKPAPTVMVVLVVAEMFGEMVDALGEHRNLDLWRAGITLMGPELGDDFTR
jgi:hypothetical protein